MRPGDKVIVSVKVYAYIDNIQLDGTFDVHVTKMGGIQLQPEIAVKSLTPSQLESIE